MTVDEEIKTHLGGMVKEAFELRFGVKQFHSGQAPIEVLEILLDTRKRLDRVEELLFRAIQTRALMGRRNTAALALADEAWDRVSTENTPRSRVVDDYTGPRERYAHNNLATLELRHTARKVRELFDVADESMDEIRLFQRGLNDYRQECLVLLRSVQFETSLERS